MSTKLSDSDRRWLEDFAEEIMNFNAGALGAMASTYRMAILELDTDDADDVADLEELDALANGLDHIIGQLDKVRDDIRALINPTGKKPA